MGLWNIEARFREGDFEAKVSIEENFSKFFVTGIDFADMANIEMVLIDDNTTISELKKELRWNSVYYFMKNGI